MRCGASRGRRGPTPATGRTIVSTPDPRDAAKGHATHGSTERQPPRGPRRGYVSQRRAKLEVQAARPEVLLGRRGLG